MERLVTELEAGRLLGPLPSQSAPRVHISPMGLVPKPHQPDRFRLIVDLSHPSGRSVNDGINRELCSLRYSSVDDAVSIVRELGKRTMLAKLDLKDAYRIVPVHPDDYSLLGIQWDGQTFVDRALPFGLCSAPKIFNAVADVITWVFHQLGIAHQLHYLDDFLFLGAPDTDEAAWALELAMRILRSLGIPVAIHKTDGPAVRICFLGIVIDTQTFELHLPRDKLSRLQDLLQSWVVRKFCQRHELESLLGHLSHAATVVKNGRTFLRQLFTLLSPVRRSHHFIHLNASARADLLWWKTFLQDWNGRSFFPQATPTIEVTSDASGSFGCGAFSIQHEWFQLEWPASWSDVSITAKELVPVVIAAALWGSSWYHQCVRFQSDNMAVVDLLRSRTSGNPLLMHLLRCLVFYAATYSFDFVAEHIPGIHNTAADALSRNNLILFSSLPPQIPGVSIPQAVLDLLVVSRPDWGSQAWTVLFKNSLTRALQELPTQCTSRAGASTSRSATSLPTPHSLSQSRLCASSLQ